MTFSTPAGRGGPLFWEALGRSRDAVRQEAEKRFDPAVTAEQFHNVLLTFLGG